MLGRMTTNARSERLRSLLLAAAAGLALIACAGCQTFSLSEEDFQKQRRGQTVDQETGEVVGVAGTLGYYGAMIGKLVSEAVKK